MRYILIALILISAATASFADRPVKSVVTHFNDMRIVYVVNQDGKKIPVVTNLDRSGKRMGRKVGPAADWTRAHAYEIHPTVTAPKMVYSSSELSAENLKSASKHGIPIPPGRSPLRAINPFRTVNPYTDPTAIPTH
jgi:hypothetical protein